MDDTGYARAVVSNDETAEATLTVNGPGTLAFRSYASYAALRMVSFPAISWTHSGVGWQRYSVGISSSGPQEIHFSVSANGMGTAEAIVDAVTWTPLDDLPFGPEAALDMDLDGVSGLIEYAFSLDPGNADYFHLAPGSARGLPSLHLGSDPASSFQLDFIRRRTGLSYLPEFTDSLAGPWVPFPERIEVIERMNPIWDRCRVTAPPGQRFGRIRVTPVP